MSQPTRTSVFHDGIPLSNLLGNESDYSLCWGLIDLDEIRSLDVMYGPYSALYSGNTIGARIFITSRMAERHEQRLVKALVTQATVEAFDIAVLLRLARRDVVPLDRLLLRPSQDHQAGQLDAVVAYDHQRGTPLQRFKEGVVKFGLLLASRQPVKQFGSDPHPPSRFNPCRS